MIDINYTHRDLKPENILIKYSNKDENNFDIKLTDFGLSTNEIHSSINYHSRAGTQNYMAPEIEKFNYNKKCDLWSLGVILYELYTNNYIFYSNDPKIENINRYEGKIAKETDNENLNKLLRKLIQVDIKKRINWEEYFNDDFFKIHNKINTNPNEQIIIIKFKVNTNNEEIKIFNGNKDINKNNIKIIIDNKEFKEEINNLKKGNYNAIIKINQKITNCEKMFYDCKNILEINFTQFDTKNVTKMNHMFFFCSSLTTLDVSKFDTKNVTKMQCMFYNCSSLTTLDVSKFDTKNVTNMQDIFKNCRFSYDKNKFK
jgi:surface protein